MPKGKGGGGSWGCAEPGPAEIQPQPLALQVELLKRGALGSIYVSAKDKIHNRLVTLKLVRRSQVRLGAADGRDAVEACPRYCSHREAAAQRPAAQTPRIRLGGQEDQARRRGCPRLFRLARKAGAGWTARSPNSCA